MFLLNILQIVVSILLVIVILFQQKGGGLSPVFGGGGGYHTRRGAERTIFTITIILATAFLIIAFLNIVLR